MAALTFPFPFFPKLPKNGNSYFPFFPHPPLGGWESGKEKMGRIKQFPETPKTSHFGKSGKQPGASTLRWAGLDDLGLGEEHGHTDVAGVAVVAHQTGRDAVKKAGERMGGGGRTSAPVPASSAPADLLDRNGQHVPAIKPPKN